MAQHKIEYWMTDAGDPQYETFDDAETSNIYHKDDNGDWQRGFKA